MIDIQKILDGLDEVEVFIKMQIEDSPVGIYCGLHRDRLPSLAFMSKTPPLQIESTQYLRVVQWSEDINVYWTRFDLELGSAKSTFYLLCMDLINASVGCSSDEIAMNAIKNKYMIWRKMFRKSQGIMTEESYKGLLGELYFLKYYLSNKIGMDEAIRAWSGPKMTAKDYSHQQEWYEIKTISAHSNVVTISSLIQLEALHPGHLVVVRVEQMSEIYDDGNCRVSQLISLILGDIVDEELKEIFLEKVLSYGYNLDSDENDFSRYKVISGRLYFVDKKFPKITTENIPYKEIVKVNYSLTLDGIHKFMEETNDFARGI